MNIAQNVMEDALNVDLGDGVVILTGGNTSGKDPIHIFDCVDIINIY